LPELEKALLPAAKRTAVLDIKTGRKPEFARTSASTTPSKQVRLNPGSLEVKSKAVKISCCNPREALHAMPCELLMPFAKKKTRLHRYYAKPVFSD
jgi:hypothetical protein